MQYQSIDESNHQFQPHSLPIHPYESNHSSVCKLSKQSISDLCVLFMMYTRKGSRTPQKTKMDNRLRRYYSIMKRTHHTPQLYHVFVRM
jgi:hypothetical protein